MADPRKDPRMRHGLIPVLVAMRVKAEREEREKQAARQSDETPADKPRKRGWRRWFGG
ncbi:hypothetical protein [uncultured Brevundimonas sp.]|uniref:hypothetical protein n=1 Tax=uncultured Brevundimonas sp. TaxID=213418 RepID=UPI0030ECA1D8|tara:strand:+ start:69192 stop:69365 length:174 start_codon:yes stop_codon:yes gene_type:complete